MKRFLYSLVICLCLVGVCAAQQNPADAPATKEDIEKYLQVMHTRELVSKTIDAMSKPMHDMVHQQFLKDKDKLPADFEARMTKIMDDMLKNIPWDDLLNGMVPVYQKHFTKGDIDALVTFYSSPTGQKILAEMPAITAETMKQMMPILQKTIEAMNQKVQDEINAMIREEEKKNEKPSPKT